MQQDPPPRAKEILSYFLRNPHAADTLEGVTTWRVIEENVHRRLEETAQALAWLVSMRFLNETSRRSSRPLFTLNREHIPDAQQFLTASGKTTRSEGA